MVEGGSDSTVVLIAEDEQELADLYEVWLSQDYKVRTAYGGQEALALFDESVDVVLLDRRMPDKAGDEVLADLRDGGFAGPVAMVSAVDPDVDLLEMDCSDYVSKPVSRDELQPTVARMVTLATQEPIIRQYYGLMARKAAVDSSQSSREIAES